MQASKGDCVGSISDLLKHLMKRGQVRQAPAEPLARLIHGGLMDAVLWIADSDQPQQALMDSLQSPDLLLDGLKVA
nr:hypothetical protein [Bowmanella denitrificans]